MDDVYLGGEKGGGKAGRGSPDKKPIVVAVQTDDKGRPRRNDLEARPNTDGSRWLTKVRNQNASPTKSVGTPRDAEQRGEPEPGRR